MGFNLSWIAVIGAGSQQLADELEFVPTGKRGSLGSQPLQGAELPGTGHLLVARGTEHAIVSPAFLATHSAKHDIVACAVEEHVMQCRAAHWHAGEMVWSAEHDGQKSRRHLVTHGTLPPAFDEIVRSATQQQDVEDSTAQEVDFFFEVPLQLAQSMVGFKHDEESPGIDAKGFETLSSKGDPAPGPEKKGWQFWR